MRKTEEELDNINYYIRKYLFAAGWIKSHNGYYIDPIKAFVEIEHGAASALAVQMGRDWKESNKITKKKVY
jgi:hypothetical protein